MTIINRSARLGRAGAGPETTAGSGHFYLDYTAIFNLVQSSACRGLMRLAVWLADLAEALAGAALRWECGL